VRAHALPYFAPVARFPGFAGALAATLSELRLARVGPAAVDKADGAARDVAELLRRFESQLDDAKIEFGLAVKFYPRYSEAHYRLAQVYERMNQPKKAIDHYLQVTRLSPGSPEGIEAQRRLNEINP